MKHVVLDGMQKKAHYKLKIVKIIRFTFLTEDYPIPF